MEHQGRREVFLHSELQVSPWLHAPANDQLLSPGLLKIVHVTHRMTNLPSRFLMLPIRSTVVAFAVGEKYEPGNGFIMIGAHTDR